MKIHLGDFCVVTGALAGLVFVVGMATGEHKARQQIATVCEPQPGAALVSSIQSHTGLVCIYSDEIQSGRVVRKKKATKA